MTSKFITRLERLEKQAGAGDEIVTLEFHEQTFVISRSEFKRMLDEISDETWAVPQF